LADNVKEGDFIYLDPPYVPEKATSFVGYTAGGFQEEDHEKLFSRCQTLRLMGIRLLMSNSDVPLVRDTFDGWEIKKVLCRRAIHSKSPDAQTNEVLILSF
jgi:DNA adenine methylase